MAGLYSKRYLMKLDNITYSPDQPEAKRRGYFPSPLSASNGSGAALKCPPYIYFFAIALVGVFLINGINTVYRAVFLKETVTYAAQKGYGSLLENFETMDNFAEARQYFLYARGLLSELTSGGGATAVAGADTLLKISVNVMESAQLLHDAELMVDEFFAHKDEKKNLGKLREKVVNAHEKVKVADELFAGIDASSLKNIPQVREVRTAVETLNALLSDMEETMVPLLTLLGDRYPHRILILFQNNHEIRPTGGFIGSLGFLDLNDGRIEKLEVRDVYEFDGIGKKREPHSEISIVAGADWGIRDSNTSPNFATSAKQTKQFLEEANGPGVDTVLAVDMEFVRSLMSLTGPLYIEAYDFTLTPENFDVVLSYLVESKAFGADAPKKILKDFLAALQTAVFEKVAPKDLLALISAASLEKHFFAYSDNEGVQNLFTKLNLDGGMFPVRPYDDYLSVVNVSVGGNKSDAFIEQNISHETFIKNEGDIRDQVTITRTHTWNDDTEKWLNDQLKSAGIVSPDPHVVRILGKDVNKVMTRVYVPYGAKLLSAVGVAEEEVQLMTEEVGCMESAEQECFRFSYFLFPMNTEIGGVSKISLAYELPFKLEFEPLDDYRLVYQKQAGMSQVAFEKYIYYGDELKSFAQNPQFTEENDADLYQALLRTDRILSVAVGTTER